MAATMVHGSMKLSTLHPQFTRELLGRGLSQDTILSYRSDFGTFLRYVPRDDLREFNVQTLRGYPGWLYERGMAASTINRHLSGLATFGEWLIDQGHLEANPVRRVKRAKRPKRLPRPVPTAQADQLLSVTDPRVHAMLALMRYAGLRRAEVVDLDVENIGPTALRVIGKGNKERVVPIAPQLRQALDAWLKVSGLTAGPLFPGRGRPRLCKEMVGRIVRERVQDLCLGNYTPHQLRHSFGTELTRAGAHPRYVQALMGHDSLETTQRYVQVSGVDLELSMAQAQAIWGGGQPCDSSKGSLPTS